MPSIDINFVMPSLLKVGAEGVIRVQPIPEVDQTKAKIDDLTLTLPGGESHAVIDYQKGFEFSDWTFSFLVPQSFHSVIGPSTMAIVSFKILAEGQVFQTLDDCIICVDTDINKPPFSVASITPTTIQLDPQSTAQVLVKGNSLDKAHPSCNLAGPSPVYATVIGASATSCTVVIKGSDVPVLGKYRILLYEATTQDTFIVPIDINIEGKDPAPNLKLLSIAPDVLAPGDSFKLNISKDVATSGWDDVRISAVQIDEASGYTSNARHSHINPVSNTECSVDCILSSAVKVLANEKATLKLLATYKMKSVNVTNTLPLTLHPDPRIPKFNVSSCLPFRAPKAFVKSPGFLFYLVGINLDQIVSLKFGNTYQMSIALQAEFCIQCRFLTPPTDIKEGMYQFTVMYDDPQSGTEKTETLQNVNVEITPY